MPTLSKTKSSFYRRLYVAHLIEQGVASVPALIEATGMPRRTAQDTIASLAGWISSVYLLKMTASATTLAATKYATGARLIHAGWLPMQSALNRHLAIPFSSLHLVSSLNPAQPRLTAQH